MGVNTSAQITELPFSADFESSIAPFDAGDIVDATGWGKALRVSNTTATATFDESISALTENDEVTIQFNALHGWEGSNKTTKIALLNTDGDELISYTYDITKCQVVDVALGGATVNGFAAFMGQANYNNSKSANGFTHSQHYVTTEGYTPVVKFVVSGSGLVSFNYAYTPAKQAALNKNFAATISGKKIDLGKIVITDNQPNTDRSFGMDNLSITKETKVTYPYTINYVDENEQTIKTAEGRAEVGDKVAIDTESFWIESKKYVYVSDDSDSKLISAEGTNVITVKVSEAPKYAYSVKDNINNILAEGTAYEGEDVVYYVPYFVYKESVFYKSPVLSAGNLSYGQSTISAISADTEITVTYTEEDGTNVVFYAEAENLNGITLVDDQYTKIRMSNGKAGYFAEKTAIETLPKGKYTITAATRSGATKFYAGNTEVYELTSTGAVTETTSDEFAIGKDTEISTSIGSASAYFDYIIIRKTGEVTEAEAELLNAKAELLEEITAAKAIDTTDKDGAEALATAITDAETALNAEGATAESLAEAKTTLAAALKVFRLANPSELMTEAKTLAADADAVAVGKLIDAIAAAEESGDETDLAAAVEQFKKDNAESGINVTSLVGTGTDKWVNAQNCPANEFKIYSGNGINLVQVFGVTGEGAVLTQEVEVENGLYNIELYATSHNAWNGTYGVNAAGTPTLQQDANDVAYVFGTSGENTIKTWITARRNSGLVSEEPEIYKVNGVEVANGKLTFGLALAKAAQTEWHTIQIASLNKITTAKTAWAAAKANLQKLIVAATDTLNTGENGKTELQAAIDVAVDAKASNKLNIAEVIAAEETLKEAIHEFFEANLQFREDVVFYIQEKQTGKFLSRGAAWGTRAVVDDYGVPVQLTYVPDGKYTIKGIDNNSTYGDDGALYSDGNGDRMRSFIFAEVEGGYTITNSNNSKFVAVVTSGTDSLGVIANSETGSIFQVLSVAQRDEIVAANKKVAEEANIAAAGFKLTDPLMFTGKVDTLTFKTGSAWTFTAERDKSNAVTNENGTEVFLGTGKFTQNIENVAAGLYKVTVQAMYRDGANGTVADLYDKGYNLSHAYLDANGSRVQVKSWGEDRLTDGNPNSMGEYAALAGEGKYVSEGLAAVSEDGKLNLTVAVPSYIGAGWFIASQVTYQKVVVDSTALARTELEKAIAKAEATDTIQRTQETINTLKAAIEAAKALVAKEDATAEELVAATTAIEDAIAGLKIEPIEGIDYSWESPKGNPIEWGGTIAYVNGDGNRLNYQNGGYYTICLNGKKANINEETPSTNAGKMVITLDKALAAGDTIAYTAFINKDATGKKASPYIIFENGITAEGEVFSDEANIDALCNGVPTLKYTIVPAEAAGSKTITLTRSQTGTNLFITKLQVIEKTELELALNVERYTGMGYGVTEATVDFTEAKAFLGVEAITEDMLSMLNPDGSEVAPKATDGWFNGEGVAETWGDNTKINVKFFEAIAGEGKYSICDMNGADEVGKTYSVKWQLKANDKKVIYTINVTFVAAPEFKPEIVKTIDVPVYMTAEAAYEELTAQFDAAEVATALNIASIADAKAYIVNVTTGSFVENTTEGWRDANGDAAQWAAATNGLCAKIQNPASGTIDYLGAHDTNFKENDTYTARWGFVANEKAVILNINITFKSAAFMTRINSLKSDSQQGVIYNMNGQKVNKAQKGLFIINGKKTVIK